MSADEFVAQLDADNRALLQRLQPDDTLRPEAEGDLTVVNLLKIALKNEIEATEIAARWLVATDEMMGGWEGCLSIPDMRGIVPRYTAVTLQALDRDGQRIDLKANDFFARVIQHEADHLNGIVYVDRMRDLSTLTHLAEWNRYWLGDPDQDD